MTGVTFNAPDDEQVYVCGDCFACWYEGGGTTAEAIRKSRGIE